MLSLFPCDWDAIGRKPDKSVADGDFLQRIAKIQGPVPVPVKQQATIKIPAREMLRPGEEVDLAEVERMLAEMDADCGGIRLIQIMRAIKKVNRTLDANIKALQAPSPVGDGAVSRKELLNLLRGFAQYSRAIEKYLREHQLSLH